MGFAPAATVLQRFPAAMAGVLRAHGMAERIIDRELAGAGDRCLAKTNNRSVVGVMNEFARLADWRREDRNRPDHLLWLSLEIAQVPSSPLYGRHVSPDRELAAVLGE